MYVTVLNLRSVDWSGLGELFDLLRDWIRWNDDELLTFFTPLFKVDLSTSLLLFCYIFQYFFDLLFRIFFTTSSNCSYHNLAKAWWKYIFILFNIVRFISFLIGFSTVSKALFCFVYDIFNTFFPHLSILFNEIVRFLSEMFYYKVWKFSSVYLQCLFNY